MGQAEVAASLYLREWDLRHSVWSVREGVLGDLSVLRKSLCRQSEYWVLQGR